MANNTCVVVFPSMFAKNKISELTSNIKKILKIHNLKFQAVTKDGSVIVVKVNDPVFASSAINLLFGIEKIIIANKIKNDFDKIISEITTVGSRLLLKGEKFYVNVEGVSSGYLPKDVEISATSKLVQKTLKLGAKPGTKTKYDKLLYTYLTKSNGYVAIYFDNGLGGVPNNSQNQKTICCIFDEFSAISCLECIKQGFDVKIIVCYDKQTGLRNLVKILNRIMPRMLQEKIEIEFYHLSLPRKDQQKLATAIQIISQILKKVAVTNRINLISLPVSPLLHQSQFIEYLTKNIFDDGLIPYLPLSGLDDSIINNMKEIGLEKHLSKIEQLTKNKFSFQKGGTQKLTTLINSSTKTRKLVRVTLGPNNVHDILDSLKIDH
jgi:adenylyl- and sulfurtransferase ThiI